MNALNANATSADRLTRITGMSFDEAKRILDVEKNDKLITMEDIEKVHLYVNNYSGTSFLKSMNHLFRVELASAYSILIL